VVITRANIIMPTVRGRLISLISSIASEQIVFSKVISTSTVNVNMFSAYLEELRFYLRYRLNKDSICLIFDNSRIHKETKISRITQSYGTHSNLSRLIHTC
ncbi:hypothetical protein CDIK_4236, partial [Cucumispora dikerogammari]